MDRSQITPGVEYAIRDPVAVGVEFQHVKVLERVRGAKWRVEWIHPNPGLVDYTESRNIVVAWEQRKAFLRDERNEATLQRVVEESGFPGNQHPVAERSARRKNHSPTRVREKGSFPQGPPCVRRLADPCSGV